MNFRSHPNSCRLALLFAIISPIAVAKDFVSVGPGSYSLERPESCEPLPTEVYRVDSLKGPVPTNQWWTSLVWKPFSQPLFAHPFTLLCNENGLVLSDPSTGITGGGGHIMGGGIPKGGDITIGMIDQTFADAKYAGSSDWFVAAEFANGDAKLRTQFGHGSPFVFGHVSGGEVVIQCGDKPHVWSGDDASETLGITIRGHHYGIFGGKNSSWEGLEGNTLTNKKGKSYFSVALLPDNTPETLKLFASVAHNHVTDSRVSYRHKGGALGSVYQVTVEAMEKGGEGTLFALYPHQWKYTASPLTELSYKSVRGEMKLAAGHQFITKVPIQGLLPVLPKEGIPDPARAIAYLKKEASKMNDEFKDTYWEGKDLGKFATMAGMADILEEEELKETFLDEIKERLENWFTASTGEEAPLFYYDKNWGTLVGSKASYGSDSQINDHHFHYGYFIRAAAEVARHDLAWAKKWAPMVNIIIRDIASNDREDPLFPYTRCFDFYAGHSWASGHADFGDGNNQESSSESLNAWYGLMLWGEAMGDDAIRDKGIFLFNTERTAVEEYWFDVSETNFPESYPHVALGMVWGGKGAFATWFSGDIDCIHGINWLPFTPASIYMGRFPNYVTKNYDRIVEQREGEKDFGTGWGDLVVMFGALSDPIPAAQYIDGNPACKLEGGNTHAFMYHWIHTLNTLGLNEASVISSHPFTNVFKKDGKKTYAAYNFGDKETRVTFSDGFSLIAAPKGLTVTD